MFGQTEMFECRCLIAVSATVQTSGVDLVYDDPIQSTSPFTALHPAQPRPGPGIGDRPSAAGQSGGVSARQRTRLP